MKNTYFAMALCGIALLAGCQEVVSPQPGEANPQLSSSTQASSSSVAEICTPLYNMIQGSTSCTQSEPVMNGVAPYCLENVRAQGCVGNYCEAGLGKWFTATAHPCQQPQDTTVPPPVDTTIQTPGDTTLTTPIDPNHPQLPVDTLHTNPQGKCTPICLLVPGQTNQTQVVGTRVEFMGEIPYCLETIQAQGCQGNFCLQSQNQFWAVCP